MTAQDPVELVRRLRELCDPLAERMSDAERLTAFVHAGAEAAALIEQLVAERDEAKQLILVYAQASQSAERALTEANERVTAAVEALAQAEETIARMEYSDGDAEHWRGLWQRAIARADLEFRAQNAVGPITNIRDLTDDQLTAMLARARLTGGR